VQTEYNYLKEVVEEIYAQCGSVKSELELLHIDLRNVNKTLWNIEDFIRDHERQENFGSDFIELARSVYYTNDDRSDVKKKINVLTGSLFVEEKSYEEY
jgi:hypothetical protein